LRLANFFIALFFTTTGFAQTGPDKYWVQFTDKNNSPFSIENPLEFLSERAIERRFREQVTIDASDLPVNPHYIDAVLSIGGIELWHTSRWMNAITIKTTLPEKLNEINALPFVATTRSVAAFRPDLPPAHQKSTATPFDTNRYGAAYQQIAQLNGHLLHAAGFQGHGQHIALMDAGYRDVDQLICFEHLRNEGRLHQVADYVVSFGVSDVADWSNHGTVVLSTMAADLPNRFRGTAPDAHYYLFRTEDGGSEYIIEEDHWIAGVEHADRIGVDLINSSLGYSEYDDENQSHSTDDMDGQTTRISRAASIAASKGIIVVTSAGNRGHTDWRIITAPGDAPGIVTVGSVDSTGTHSWFSSYGPSSDNRVKPEVMAMGEAAACVTLNDEIVRLNGTSFASPITCGLIACLREAHPLRRSDEIIDAVIRSSSHFTAPNDSMGYGIPDFWRAHLLLRGNQPVESQSVVLYPNPTTDRVFVEWNTQNSEEPTCIWRLIDVSGRALGVGQLHTVNQRVLGNFGLPAGCPSGTYLLELQRGTERTVSRLQVNRNQ